MSRAATDSSDHASPNQSAIARTTPISSLATFSTRFPNTSVNSFCGALAGVASGIVTCPLDVIKTKLQAQGSFRRQQALSGTTPTAAIYRGLLGTGRTIFQQDGVRGLYRGLGPMLLGYLPTWAVYMSVYDVAKEYYYTKAGKTDVLSFDRVS